MLKRQTASIVGWFMAWCSVKGPQSDGAVGFKGKYVHTTMHVLYFNYISWVWHVQQVNVCAQIQIKLRTFNNNNDIFNKTIDDKMQICHLNIFFIIRTVSEVQNLVQKIIIKWYRINMTVWNVLIGILDVNAGIHLFLQPMEICHVYLGIVLRTNLLPLI